MSGCPVIRRRCQRWAGALLLAALAALAPITGAPRLQAEETPPDPNLPLIVVNVASVERLLNQAIVTFEAAGRPELSETLGSALEKVNDLKGFDRSQSVGVMIFLNGIMPEAVGYAPVKDLDAVLKTMEIGPVTTKKTGDDRFEIAAGRQTFHGRVRDDYAFFAANETALDRQFRDPARLTARLSNAYDLAVSLNLKNIPQTTRELFLSVLRANSESDLQRRDNEPESAHRLRKAAGLHNIEVIEELIAQGEDVTIGWSISETDRKATLEVVVGAVPGSDFAAFFNSLKGHRGRFTNLVSGTHPLTAGLSWKLDPSVRKMFHEMIAGVETQLRKSLPDRTDDAKTADGDSSADPVGALVKALRATADGGHLDAAAQFVRQPQGSFVLVGGVGIVDASTLSGAMSDLMTRFKGNENVSNVKLNVLTHEGIAIHRLEFKQDGPQEERFYGGKPGLYLGVGDDAVWFALGGSEAPAELKRAIDLAAEPIPEGVTQSPFQFVMNFASWMDVFDPDQKAEGFAALARGSFAKGKDALRIEALPIDDGLRLRITMDEAFLRLVGEQIARQFDANSE